MKSLFVKILMYSILAKQVMRIKNLELRPELISNTQQHKRACFPTQRLEPHLHRAKIYLD